MVSGTKMTGFADAFGVTLDQRTYPFTAKVVTSSVPGNVLWPNDQPTFTIQLVNNTASPIQGNYAINVVPYGTKGAPGDIWTPQVERLGDPIPVPIAVDLAANGHQDVTLSPQIPAKFGAYALVADLGPSGRQFITTMVRTFEAKNVRVQYPSFCLDEMNLDVLKRLGVHAIRFGLDYVPTTDKNFDQWYANLQTKMKAYNDANISVLAMIGAGTAPQPLGMPRPWLTDDGVMRSTKSDLAWLPSSDPDFQAFCHKMAADFGWPKGPVNAFSLWNEPWEGISISGWGADMLRYRELYTRMALGVDDARQHDGVDVLVGGCDSSSNAMDKLFSDGTDSMLKYFDFLSIHYQGLSSYANVKMWANRQNPRGRVKIWDTESWVANTDDRVAAVVAGDRAAGYDRAMGVFRGNVQDESTYNVVGPDGRNIRVTMPEAWSTAASVGAATHFLGERSFNRLLFPNGLPWVMVFDGLKDASGAVNPEDGTVVVVGDLGEEFGANLLPLRTARGFSELKHKAELRAQLAALPASTPDADRAKLQLAYDTPETLSNSAMTIVSQPGFSLYDYYGNPVPAVDGKITVPLDGRGFFLRGDGAPGSFARLISAIQASTIAGIEPVAIVAHDMTKPIEDHPVLRVSLTNVLNHPVTGSLDIHLGALKVADIPAVTINPSETQTIAVNVVGGSAVPSNTYPLTAKFDAGAADGAAILQEDMHVNIIAHRSIKVDGNLDDWKGVLPQIVTAGSGGPTLAEAAWFPFKKFDTNTTSGLATGYMAYDDKNFYFAAKVADNTPDPGMVRMATRNDDDYYYPAVTYKLDADTVLQKKDGTWTDSTSDVRGLQSPADPKLRSNNDWETTVNQFAVDFKIQPGKLYRVSFYFVDNDGRRSTKVTAIDKDTGKVLATQIVDNYKLGNYATFDLAGNVRLVFSTNNWLPVSLAGFFFDPAPTDAAVPTGNYAKFVKLDLTSQGNWKGVYGASGYNVAGTPGKYPADVTVDVPEVVSKSALQWPDGVRRYSYRKGPELPSGNAPRHDNVQIAFNVLSPDQKPWYPNSPGTMPGFINYKDTDYEYALNPIAPQYGGGVEIWRLDTPGMPHKHFYPREPKSPFDGPVDGKLVVTSDGNTRIVEAAIPWTEIPEVKKCLDAGTDIKFSFRVNDNMNPATMELSRNRSVAKRNPSFHADWMEHWANEIEFGWEK